MRSTHMTRTLTYYVIYNPEQNNRPNTVKKWSNRECNKRISMSIIKIVELSTYTATTGIFYR
jgi:uncharacterized protein YlbG (UPF0298 family)